jgi:hypothetical protein
MRTLLIFCPFLLAAQDSAVLTGVAEDPRGAPVPGVTVRIVEAHNNLSRSATSDETGAYLFDALPPGDYVLTADKEGFSKLTLEHIALTARGRRSVRLQLSLASITNSVTVEGTVEGIATDPSTGTTISGDSTRFLPVNGRNVDGLVRTAPGIVTGEGGPFGDMSVNGLRSNTNYYTLDGVSLGAGSTVPMAAGGPMPGASAAAQGGNGTGTNQVSLDSLQEIRVQTSSFAPEFGRTPGAQVALTSRGGSNQFHGSLFEYYRNGSLNANDWFANAAGLPRGQMRLNQFGAAIGGPIIRDRTFFFSSYEGLRLLEPDTAVASVPDLTIRKTAPASLRPFLKAFPIPNGPELGSDAAQFSAVFSNPTNRDTASLRLDHTFTPRNYFSIRYGYTPAKGNSRSAEFAAPNMYSTYNVRNQSVTVSLQSTPKSSGANDLRFNYTASSLASYSLMDTFGGAQPLPQALVFPPGVDSTTGSFNFMVLGFSSYSLGQQSKSSQWQANIVDGLTMIAGRHQYKTGVDYRRIAQTSPQKPYTESVTFSGLAGDTGSLLSGKALSAIVSSNVPAIYPEFQNFSVYLQDTFQMSPETTITYGARWDVNPAPSARQGPAPLALSSYFPNQVTQLEPLYDTRWSDVAPRFGLSHQFGKSGREKVFRGGMGIFHDLGYGTSVAAFAGAPYASVRTMTSVAFPLSAANLSPPAMPPVPPYGQISAAQRNLQSPVVYEWNTALEWHFGRDQTLTTSYVGTMGRKLLRTTMQPSFNGTYDIIRLATNGADSDYNALQVQWVRRFVRNLQVQVNYTYSHSIDSASNDAGFGFASLFGGERGNSDFDVRHNLNMSGSYLLPSPSEGVLHALLKDWWSEWMFTARTGLPFDVQGVSAESSSSGGSGTGLFAQVRPDYTGAPVWIDDPNAPASRRLNPAAFASPDKYQQGNLGRNAIHGFGEVQLDFSLRRRIVVTERWSLNLMAQAFNISNSPNFANPTRNEGANMASSNFGVATRMLGKGFGVGAGSAFRTGGPRSAQFGLRLQF